MANVVHFRYGGQRGKRFRLSIRDDLLVVRMHGQGLETAKLTTQIRESLNQFDTIWKLPAARVQVLQCRASRAVGGLRDRAKTALNQHKDEVKFAGRVFVDERNQAVLYTENIFLQFAPEKSPTYCKRAMRELMLTIKRPIEYARNAWFVEAQQGVGSTVFSSVAEILARDDVMLCHPELVRRASQKQTAKPQQWHLRRTRINGVSINEHANVQSAWSLSEGEGMTIAIIDDGVDVNHEEFQTGGKIVAPRDVTQRSNNAAPGPEDMHGTACAGVACANGAHGATGVAPRARLMPIRLTSGLGSQAEADAFEWAATHGADVISCSWGPPDGEWWNDDDPQHDVVSPLPDSTRLAIDYAVNHGRNGKGCVITWAAGNGNESVTNDHYASYDKVIAVGACNDEGKRSAYSDIGSSLWCCFPSGDPDSTRTPGIWTTDNSGLFGYNDGNTDEGDAAGNYTNSFSGTSSSCPGVAGVCALVLARNPDLTWDQVRDILRQSADHIDARRGEYDADGHSLNYGYGRLNALHAVELASPATTNRRSVLHRTNRNVRIRDRRTARLGVRVSDTESLKDIMIHVDIEHTWIGDLRVRLRSPSSLRVRPIVLHNRTGREKDNIRRSYTVADIPALAAFIGQPATGRWRLEVYDAQRGDKGRIVSFGIEIIL